MARQPSTATDSATAEVPESPTASGSSESPPSFESPPSPAPPPPPDPVEWGPVRYERLRSLAAGATLSVLCALVLFVGAVVAMTGIGALSAVIAGNAAPVPAGETLLLFGVLLLVGGPVSLVYLLVAYDRSTPEARSSLRGQFGSYSYDARSYRPRWVAVGSLLAVAVGWWVLSGGVGGALSPMLVLAVVFLPMLAGTRGTSFRLDPASATLTSTYHSHDRTNETDVSAVVRYRRLDLPWTTLFVIPARGKQWLRSTPWLFVPRDRADAVEERVRWVIEHTDGPERISRTERVVLVAVGSSALVTGTVFAVLGGADGGWVLTLLSLPVALLFLVLAARL